MDIIATAVKLLSEDGNLQVDPDQATNALSTLLGDGQGGIDLAGLAGKMASSGQLSDIVSSWLGDGSNSPISTQSLQDLLGGEKLEAFASSIGADSETATQGLAQVLPKLMDQSSSGGSLLEAAEGAGGLLGAAKSLLS